MKKLLLAIVMAVLVMTFLTSLAFAAPVATPFKGTMTGTETNVFDFPNQRFFVTGHGSGTATHLGAYTVTYGAEVYLPTSQSTNVTATFVAANGDMLFAAGTGQGHPAGDITTIEESLTITGGTGRFEGATGSYIIYRTVVRATGETWGDFEGTLVLDTGK